MYMYTQYINTLHFSAGPTSYSVRLWECLVRAGHRLMYFSHSQSTNATDLRIEPVGSWL